MSNQFIPARVAESTGTRPEVNFATGIEVVQKADGSVVRRTIFNTGNIAETTVYAPDYEADGKQKNADGEQIMRLKA